MKPIRVISHLPDLVRAKFTITSPGTLAVNLSIEGPISQLTTAVGGTVPTFKHLHFSIPKSIMAHPKVGELPSYSSLVDGYIH